MGAIGGTVGRVIAVVRAMPRSTSKSNPPKWVLALCREMQTSIGQQLQLEGELPKELAPDLSALVTLPRQFNRVTLVLIAGGRCDLGHRRTQVPARESVQQRFSPL